MANWSNPLLTSTYTNFLTEVKDRDTDLALQFDGTTSSNIPTGAIRWNSSVNRWQKWNGSSWGELTSTYALTGLSTTGNATIGGTLGSGAFTSSGTVTGTALLPTGSSVPANGIYLPSANTLGIATATTCRVLVNSNGRVGIGTTSPSTGFHIANAPGSATIGNLYISNSGQARYHLYNGGGQAEWIFGQKSISDHDFKLSKSVAGSESDYFTIDTSGNVGIGGNPTAVKLYVNGQITGSSSTYALRASNGGGTDQTTIGLTRVGASTDQKSWELLHGTNNRFSIRTINDTYTDGQEGITFQRGSGYNVDSVQLSTMGSSRLYITSGGNVGIGTTTPSALLHVAGVARIGANDTSDAELQIGMGATGNRNAYIDLVGDTTHSDYGLRLIRFNGGANSDSSLAHRGTGTLYINCQDGGSIGFKTSDIERGRIDGSGKLLFGTTGRNNFFNSTNTAGFQFEGQGGFASFVRTDNDIFGAGAVFAKTRSSGNTIVQVGDTVGILSFQGNDGSEFVECANIQAFIDGVPNANDMPGRLVFTTTPAGSTAPLERARITSTGRLGLGTTAPNAGLDVSVSPASATIGNIRIYPTTAGQARYHLYNGGATAEWIFGQKTSTDHDFKLSKLVGGSESDYLAITTSGVFKFDSGYGSAAPAYGCRAWVNFDGTGVSNTNQTIRASGNVASVYKTSTGNYQVNFATAMPDANYTVSVMSSGGGSGIAVRLINPTTTGFTVYTSDTDGSVVCATVFR